VKLKDTLCIPDLRNNLLFAAKVPDNGYIVTFTKHYPTINPPDGSLALNATKYNDLYNIHNKEERAILTKGRRIIDLIK